MAAMIPPLLPAVLRHLRGYAEVAGEDARDAAATLARRVASLLLATVVAVVALLMFCVFVLALAWDTPWRAWVAAGLVILFGAIAAGLALPVLKRRPNNASVYFSRLRHELRRDRELIERAMNGDESASH